jgi:hypothetical protein
MICALVPAGCLDGESGSDPVSRNRGAPTDSPDLSVDYAALFSANVEPILTTYCSACHNRAGGIGPGFLEPKPDVLTTVLGHPGLIGTTPENSRILEKGAHEGPALTLLEALPIAEWIKIYNQRKLTEGGDGGAPKPAIVPFPAAIGANIIDLSTLDPSLEGQTVTFNAKLLGSSQIELSSIKVNAARTTGIHLQHPLWVTWDLRMNPTPDPGDNFATLDQTVFAAGSEPMGLGLLVLPYTPSQSLSVVFGLIEPKAGGSGAGSGMLACKNVAGFSAAKSQLTGAAGIACSNCHAQQGNAALAFNLVGIAQAANDQAVCLSVRGEVDPEAPANSTLYKRVDPAGPAHTGGKLTPPQLTELRTAMDAWITSEK